MGFYNYGHLIVWLSEEIVILIFYYLNKIKFENKVWENWICHDQCCAILPFWEKLLFWLTFLKKFFRWGLSLVFKNLKPFGSNYIAHFFKFQNL
jgi:hypothetical protein